MLVGRVGRGCRKRWRCGKRGKSLDGEASAAVAGRLGFVGVEMVVGYGRGGKYEVAEVGSGEGGK